MLQIWIRQQTYEFKVWACIRQKAMALLTFTLHSLKHRTNEDLAYQYKNPRKFEVAQNVTLEV